MESRSGEYSGIGGKSAGCKSFGGGGGIGSSETNLYGETENWRVEIHPEPRWDRSRVDRPNDRVAEAIVASMDRRLDGCLLVDVFHLQVRFTLNLAGYAT